MKIFGISQLSPLASVYPFGLFPRSDRAMHSNRGWKTFSIIWVSHCARFLNGFLLHCLKVACFDSSWGSFKIFTFSGFGNSMWFNAKIGVSFCFLFVLVFVKLKNHANKHVVEVAVFISELFFVSSWQVQSFDFPFQGMKEVVQVKIWSCDAALTCWVCFWVGLFLLEIDWLVSTFELIQWFSGKDMWAMNWWARLHLSSFIGYMLDFITCSHL